MSQKFNTPEPPSGRRSGTMVAGTVMAVLAAGIAWQLGRANPANGQESTANGRATASSPHDKVLARVNGQIVRYDMVAQECMDRYGVEVLENVINRVLIQQACKSKGLSVNEQEVSHEISRISKRFGLDTETWYKMLQAERGLTPLQYQRDVIWPMLALRKLAGKNVTITQDMMRQAYFDAYGPKAKVKMIMLDNRRRAEKVWEDAKAHPADFGRLAQEHSVEPNSKSLGGAVPPIRRYTGAHDKVREAAFAMRTPGEVSPIIEVGLNSYVIMKFEGFTEKVQHDANDVKAQLHEELMEQEVQRLVAETFQTIRDSAQIQNQVTGESTTTRNPVTSAGGPAGGVRQTGYQPQVAPPRR
jgi:foldase protein PrsA